MVGRKVCLVELCGQDWMKVINEKVGKVVPFGFERMLICDWNGENMLECVFT